jgi:TolA-binding protein
VRSQPCTRVWAAEAARDGRVSAAEKASFFAHAAQCTVCTAEMRRLQRIGDALRTMRVRRLDELRVRRHRQELLATLDSATTRPARSRAHWFVACGAAVLLLGAALAVSLWFYPRPTIYAARGTRMVHVWPVEARWSTHREGVTEIIVLEDGHLEIQSTGSQGEEHRLVVRVPDGEIEDVGTRFTVLVSSGQTESIEVSEGLVVFRLHGEPDRQVRAGEHWVRLMQVGSKDRPSQSEAEVASAQPLPAVGLAPGPRARVKPASSEHAAARASPRSADDSPTRAKTVAPSNRGIDAATLAAGQAFAGAIAAFRQAQFAQAASAFERFSRDFPSDPRSEDATFLRAVAQARTGDAEGAARMAREYLARYPRGLRRAEAERLAVRLGASSPPE